MLGHNPTRQAITWAWCRVELDRIVSEGAGWIRASELPMRPETGIAEGTNNQAEFYAILDAFEHLEDGAVVTVYSDSRIAINWWENVRSNLRSIPIDWRIRQNRELRRHGGSEWRHLHGHPTARKLADQADRRARGEDVSEDGYSIYNDHVDRLCRSMSALAQLALTTERECGVAVSGGRLVTVR